MKVELLAITPDCEKLIEEAGRTCYKSKPGNPEIIKNWIRSGHESMIEHASVTFRVSDVSRSLSHQLVRHRIASYSQQSQRYTSILDFKDMDKVSFIDGEKRDNKCLFSIKDEEILCDYYKQGYTSSDLADKYGCHPTTILAILRHYNVEVRKNSAESKGINSYYFDNIDSPLKAQILGFVYADGCICDNQLWFDQAEENYVTLNIIRNQLKPTGNIYLENKETDTRQNIYRFSVGSHHLINRIKSIGIKEDKSKTIKLDEVYTNIPDEFKVDLLKGIFEGDGHIGLKNPYSCFVISGNLSTCTVYQDILCDVLKLKKNKIYNDGLGNCQLTFSSNKVTTEIMEYIYQHDSPMFFPKKLYRASVLSDILQKKYNEAIEQYCNLFEFVCPKSISKDYILFNKYIFLIDSMQQMYKRMLMSNIKKEDARAVLPNCCTTELVFTFNFRSLRNFLSLRLDSHAQEEIRILANEILKIVKPLAPNVFFDFAVLDI